MRHSLRYKLVSIVFLAAIPFLLYAIYHYLNTVDASKTNTIAKNRAKAAELATELVDFIESSQNVLYSLALHPDIVSNNSARCDTLFSQLLPLYPLHLNILAADMQGRNFASALEPHKAHHLTYGDKEWFQRGSKGISVVTDLHLSKLFTQPAFMITMPVFDKSGSQSAVLGFPVSLERLRSHFIEIGSLDARTTASVVDNHGVTLLNTAVPEATGKPFGQPLLLQQLLKEQSGYLLAADANGVERFYCHATVEATGWKVLVEIPASAVYADANRGAIRHLIFFLLICLTGGLTALVFSRQLIGKMDLIIKGLNEVAAGNYACRLQVRGNDEIARAGEAFNLMTAERARAEEEIMNFTATLEKRVEQRTTELTRTKHELEAFSYAVSHDLQAPVRHILSYSGILLQEHASELSESGRDCLQRINRSGLHMRELIIHLLELSRLNQQELHRVEIDLGSISSTICREKAAETPARQVTVDIATGLIARCDPALIAIAMENLLANAWKYTRNTCTPCIEVGTTVHQGTSCFFVRDNGCGFDMTHAGKLFTPFQRLHSAEEFEGTGVGLATVMRIIQRHEGSIWAESSPGHGATFYFTLNHEASIQEVTQP